MIDMKDHSIPTFEITDVHKASMAIGYRLIEDDMTVEQQVEQLLGLHSCNGDVCGTAEQML